MFSSAGFDGTNLLFSDASTTFIQAGNENYIKWMGRYYYILRAMDCTESGVNLSIFIKQSKITIWNAANLLCMLFTFLYCTPNLCFSVMMGVCRRSLSPTLVCPVSWRAAKMCRHGCGFQKQKSDSWYSVCLWHICGGLYEENTSMPIKRYLNTKLSYSYPLTPKW